MANKNHLLDIGDKIDLYSGTGPTYRTKLEDITKSGNLLVSVPTYKGIPIEVNIGDGLQLYFYRTNGRYRVNIRVVDFIKMGSLRLMELKLLSEPQKQQRRESFRLQIELKVKIAKIDVDPETGEPIPGDREFSDEVVSTNISATGIAIKSKKQYMTGDRLLMRIYLKWPDGKNEILKVLGEVVQTEQISSIERTYSAGIMFINNSKELYSNLSKFVMVQEQKKLKQQRLIEDS